jgi:hypothetical protein
VWTNSLVYGRARLINRASSQSLIMYLLRIMYIQSFILNCEVKFLLYTKLIDSKNYDKCSVFVAAVTKLFISLLLFI